MSAPAYERDSGHESDRETDSDAATEGVTTNQTASDAPTPTSRGGRGDDFSGLLEENYAWSRHWKRQAICWAQRRVECMELLEDLRVQDKHDFKSKPNSPPTGESITKASQS
jgi:hypothetical protein